MCNGASIWLSLKDNGITDHKQVSNTLYFTNINRVNMSCDQLKSCRDGSSSPAQKIFLSS